MGGFLLKGLDFVLLFLLIYEVFLLLKRTNSVQALKPAFIIIVVGLLISFFRLPMLSWLIRKLGPSILLSFVIIFQPELRKIIMKMGNISLFYPGSKKKTSFTAGNKISGILDAAFELAGGNEMQSKSRGMLVVFLRNDPMSKIVDDEKELNGEELNADISKNLLVTIFKYDTPLHDGAVIIQDDKIVRAGSHLPLSNNYNIKKSTYGTRHCAALGASEKSDAVALIVSEESGHISIACDGQMHPNLERQELEQILSQLLSEKSKKTPEQEEHGNAVQEDS